MTLLYSDPRFLDHRTGAHPERPQRLEQIVAHLARTGLDAPLHAGHVAAGLRRLAPTGPFARITPTS